LTSGNVSNSYSFQMSITEVIITFDWLAHRLWDTKNKQKKIPYFNQQKSSLISEVYTWNILFIWWCRAIWIMWPCRRRMFYRIYYAQSDQYCRHDDTKRYRWRCWIHIEDDVNTYMMHFLQKYHQQSVL